MRSALSLTFLLGLIGCFSLLTGLQDPLNSSQAFAAQLVSDEKLQAMEAVHKRNIGQLHGLHHDMRATLKQLTRNPNDPAARQLVAQLEAVRQALDIVAATEQDHPQWALSWNQRHARLVALTQEMEALLLAGEGSRDGTRSLNQLGKKLQEMKEILDIW